MQHMGGRRDVESPDGRTAIERRANARIQLTRYLVLYSRIRDVADRRPMSSRGHRSPVAASAHEPRGHLGGRPVSTSTVDVGRPLTGGAQQSWFDRRARPSLRHSERRELDGEPGIYRRLPPENTRARCGHVIRPPMGGEFRGFAIDGTRPPRRETAAVSGSVRNVRQHHPLPATESRCGHFDYRPPRRPFRSEHHRVRRQALVRISAGGGGRRARD